ncbi:MAG: RNA polymerase sigma factor [Dehalococcoidales bacterium]|nr:RNA polymerase sigma factor [Dehalococcoidales bacterium]
MEEKDILEMVLAGHPDAFSEIVQTYHPPILRYLYRYTFDYETARDLSQDTFLQAYREIPKLKSLPSFKPWLYRIATNNALQFCRRKKILSFVSLKDEIQIESPSTQPAELDETISVKTALSQVPGKLRICLILHFMEGFKYKEIAETLHISEEAVRKRVARGSLEFKKHYTKGG